MGTEDQDVGGFRSTDHWTSKAAAESISATRMERVVLSLLDRMPHALNGWEMAGLLDLTTITVVPRLAPLYRSKLIEHVGYRPGPPSKRSGKARSQKAYVITPRGREVLTA